MNLNLSLIFYQKLFSLFFFSFLYPLSVSFFRKYFERRKNFMLYSMNVVFKKEWSDPFINSREQYLNKLYFSFFASIEKTSQFKWVEEKNQMRYFISKPVSLWRKKDMLFPVTNQTILDFCRVIRQNCRITQQFCRVTRQFCSIIQQFVE